MSNPPVSRIEIGPELPFIRRPYTLSLPAEPTLPQETEPASPTTNHVPHPNVRLLSRIMLPPADLGRNIWTSGRDGEPVLMGAA